MAALIYDGECPFCARYADFVAIKKRLPDLDLINAREQPDHDLVREALAAGLVLDEGMVLFVDGKMLHGAEALAALAPADTPLSKAKWANKAYPWLRGGRNLALKILGRKKMGY